MGFRPDISQMGRDLPLPELDMMNLRLSVDIRVDEQLPCLWGADDVVNPLASGADFGGTTSFSKQRSTFPGSVGESLPTLGRDRLATSFPPIS